MRVLFFAPAGEYGGAHSLLRLLEQAEGRFSALVVGPAPSTLSRRLASLGVDCRPFIFNRYTVRQRPDWHVRMVWKLYRLLTVNRIDVVVVNHTGNAPLIMAAALMAGRPVVRIMRHSLAQLGTEEFDVKDRFLIRRCAGLVFITEFIARETLRTVPRCPAGLVLYNPQPIVECDDGRVASIRAELGIPTDAPVLGAFGRVERRKGQDVLIAACARVVKRYPQLRVILAGDCPDPEYAKSVREAIHSQGLHEHVLLTGRRDDVAELIRICSVVVMPSRAEALGRVLLEAWAAGRPVIGCDVEGIAEVVRKSGGGILCPAASPGALADSIEQLLENPIQQATLAANGRRWVSKNCDPAEYADKFTRFLARVVDNHEGVVLREVPGV